MPDQNIVKTTYEFKELELLEAQITQTQMPEDLKAKSLTQLERLNRMAKFGSYSAEFEVVSRWISWIVALPWESFSQDQLDLVKAQAILDTHHFGMQKIKDRILEYLATLKLSGGTSRATILCLIGLPGIGKTTVAEAVADCLNREFIRIAMGGMGSATQLRGVSKNLPNAEPGEIIKGLRRVKTRNPVILFDELDRVAASAISDVMGVLLEILDVEQNQSFTDYYIDYPFDLSKALFMCSANNTGGIANAVLDRLEVLEMPSYTDEEKKIIGQKYLLPKALKASGLTLEQVQIAPEIWDTIIRPLGYDAGIRTLDRTIRGICGRAALMIVEGKGTSFALNETNIKEFLTT